MGDKSEGKRIKELLLGDDIVTEDVSGLRMPDFGDHYEEGHYDDIELDEYDFTDWEDPYWDPDGEPYITEEDELVPIEVADIEPDPYVETERKDIDSFVERGPLSPPILSREDSVLGGKRVKTKGTNRMKGGAYVEVDGEGRIIKTTGCEIVDRTSGKRFLNTEEWVHRNDTPVRPVVPGRMIDDGARRVGAPAVRTYVDVNNDFFFRFNEVKDDIISQFNDFSFSKLDGFITKIGSDSANAFNFEMIFKERSNKMKNVLKNSQSIGKDNNYYEFLVGVCLNEVKSYWPNFMYTFNYYELPPNVFRYLQDKNKIIKENKKRRVPYPLTQVLGRPIYGKSFPCETFRRHTRDVLPKATYSNISEIERGIVESSCQKTSSILIEEITENISIEDFIKNYYSNEEMLNILLQTYILLSALDDVFTHYDLHAGNVLLKKVPDNKYVKIFYKGYFGSVDLVLRTKYIPVIIDYGRSFIDCSKYTKKFITSKNFGNKICATRCNKSRDRSCDAGSFNRDSTNRPKEFSSYMSYENGIGYRIEDGLGYLNPEINNINQDNRFIVMVLNLLLLNRKGRELSNILSIINWPKLKVNGREERSYVYAISKDSKIVGKANTVYDITEILINKYNQFNLKNWGPTEVDGSPTQKYGDIELYGGKNPWKFKPA